MKSAQADVIWGDSDAVSAVGLERWRERVCVREKEDWRDRRAERERRRQGQLRLKVICPTFEGWWFASSAQADVVRGNSDALSLTL